MLVLSHFHSPLLIMPPKTRTRRPCRFFSQTGSCRAGDQCTFQHASPAPAPPQATTRTPAITQPDTTLRPVLSNRPIETPGGEGADVIAPAPLGTCRIYWVQRDCRNGFNCRFRHIFHSDFSTTNGGRGGHGRGRGRGGAPTTSPRPFISSGGTGGQTMPILTEETLETLGTTTTDGYFSVGKFLNTTEAHNQVKRFLLDKYEWRSTFEVYAFLQPLSSANVNNTDWVRILAPLFLELSLTDCIDGRRSTGKLRFR